MQQYHQHYPSLLRLVKDEILGSDENARQITEDIIDNIQDTLTEQENNPITEFQMKDIIMGSVSVPLFIDNAMNADVSLIDRLISRDLAIRTMQAIASDSPNEYHFDPEYNDLSWIVEDVEKEKLQ